MLKRTGPVVPFLLAGLGALLVLQLIPYGHQHTNPPVIKKIAWENSTAADLVTRACYDCHSHETSWPWYSWVAPVSWLVQHDVEEGRRKLNFSDWNGNRKGENIDKIEKELREGEMPPLPYLLAHPRSRLTVAEKKTLCDGLAKVSRSSPAREVTDESVSF